MSRDELWAKIKESLKVETLPSCTDGTTLKISIGSFVVSHVSLMDEHWKRVLNGEN